MLTINNKDNLNSYKEAWTNNQIITINNFLKIEDAELLENYVLNIKEEDWKHSIHPYLNNCYTFDNNDDNRHHITIGSISSLSAYNKGEFSYHFRRFEEFYNDDSLIKKLLSSSIFTDLIKQITDIDVTTIVSVFGSMYQKDNFLSTHQDNGRGKIAFVYNLTKDWKEEYGGNFVLIKKDGQPYKVVPTFNSLTLFYVGDNGQPHYVEKVNVDRKRIAFSGWLT